MKPELLSVTLKLYPLHKKKCIREEKVLLDLWLAMDEIKAKVSYKQTEIRLNQGRQMSLFCIRSINRGQLPVWERFYVI